MASATTISPTMVLSNANGHHDNPQKASEWAFLLQQELLVMAPYDDVTQIPSNIFINESILQAPRRRAADPAAAQLAKEISHIMYPSFESDSEYPIIQYEKDLVRLRKLVSTQRKRTIDENTKRNELLTWVHRIAKQGAWNPATDPVSLNGAPSLPMPVEIAEAATLTPFFQHLALGGDAAKTSTVHGGSVVNTEAIGNYTQALEFEKGVLYADRRMDLCKMVLGPNNIAALMESLKTNEFVTHFLLGNNIIGPHGAKCIADFLKEFPNRMDTWYLAGNCIDAHGFRLLVDEWVQSTSVTNIWLKRNPLGSTAADDVFRLITQTPNLRTLDLDQTELGDDGVANLFTALETYDRPVAIRNVYMNALGVGVNGAAAIAKYLASPHCALEGLYLTNNPMGNDGVVALTAGLKKNKSLSRLALASVGVSDDGIIALCDALEKHPNLITLDVGQSYATQDLDGRYNWLTERSAFAIHNLVACSPKLAYFNIAYCAMTHLGLSTILDAIVSSTTLMFYRASSIWPQSRVPSAVRAGQEHIKLSKKAHTTLLKNVQATYGEETTYDDFMNDHKRWLINDKTDVRKIDSVYRNRDAGLARRGLKKLDKWWDEGDETFKEVMGAVGPVCTKRK